MMNKKGQFQLPLLLSIITLLFLIGMVVFLFTLMGGQVSDSLPQPSPIVFNQQYQENPNTTGAEDTVQLINATYTKPNGVTGAIWTLNYTNPSAVAQAQQVVFNSTSNSACWNAFSDRIETQYTFEASTPYVRGWCYNGTDYEMIINVNIGGNYGLTCSDSSGGTPQATFDGVYTSNYVYWKSSQWWSCVHATPRGFQDENIEWTVQSGGTGGSPAIPVIDETKDSIAGVTTWFAIIIVIGAMVVLIGLVVLILNAIKQTRLVSA